MKKNSTVQPGPTRALSPRGRLTIGLDLGDRSSRYCVLDVRGEVQREASVATTHKGLCQAFGALARCRIVLETGTHSPWVSRRLHRLSRPWWTHPRLTSNRRAISTGRSPRSRVRNTWFR